MKVVDVEDAKLLFRFEIREDCIVIHEVPTLADHAMKRKALLQLRSLHGFGRRFGRQVVVSVDRTNKSMRQILNSLGFVPYGSDSTDDFMRLI